MSRFNLASVCLCVLAVSACTRSAEQAKRDYIERGDNYVKANNLDAAIIEYRNAIQRDPRFAEAYEKLTTLYVSRGDGPNALRNATHGRRSRARLHGHADPGRQPASDGRKVRRCQGARGEGAVQGSSERQSKGAARQRHGRSEGRRHRHQGARGSDPPGSEAGVGLREPGGVEGRPGRSRRRRAHVSAGDCRRPDVGVRAPRARAVLLGIGPSRPRPRRA